MSRDPESSPELYLDLLKKCLTRYLFLERWRLVQPPRRTLSHLVHNAVEKLLALGGYALVRRVSIEPEVRAQARDWPPEAETMIGLAGLDNLQHCVTEVIRNKVPGDLIETGVWRGGACIFMRGILKAYGETDRVVWVADSFSGIPLPNPALYPRDAGDRLWRWPELAVPVEEVRRNFARYDLLDDQVRFLVGRFSDTLASAPIERLAVLRLDGDLYESTMDALVALYDKVSMGGYVIVDDYHAMQSCEAAVDDFRRERGITEPWEEAGCCGIYWQRGR